MRWWDKKPNDQEKRAWARQKSISKFRGKFRNWHFAETLLQLVRGKTLTRWSESVQLSSYGKGLSSILESQLNTLFLVWFLSSIGEVLIHASDWTQLVWTVHSVAPNSTRLTKVSNFPITFKKSAIIEWLCPSLIQIQVLLIHIIVKTRLESREWKGDEKRLRDIKKFIWSKSISSLYLFLWAAGQQSWSANRSFSLGR